MGYLSKCNRLNLFNLHQKQFDIAGIFVEFGFRHLAALRRSTYSRIQDQQRKQKVVRLLSKHQLQRRMRTIEPLQQQTMTSPIQNTDKPRHTPSDRPDRRTGNARCAYPTERTGGPDKLTTRGTVEEHPPHLYTKPWLLLLFILFRYIYFLSRSLFLQ